MCCIIYMEKKHLLIDVSYLSLRHLRIPPADQNVCELTLIMGLNETCGFHVMSILIYFYTDHRVEVERTLANFINIALSFPTAFLNALVLMTILRKSSLRTSPNVFLCCLASSDLFMAVVAVPSYSIKRTFQ